MKQLVQHLATGVLELAEAPCPHVGPGRLLIRTQRSLISPGTERALLSFGRAGWIGKARQQPEKVRQLLEKIHTDGVLASLDAVRSKLDAPLPLGYSNVGVVLEVGSGVTGFAVGDRVVSNGPHAEVVCVPRNLCAAIPDEVSDEEAAFTVLAAIGLQGVRLAAPTLGERFAVIGLGAIGLLAVQLLRAQGVSVLGLDFDPQRLELAAGLGAEVVALGGGADPVRAAEAFSRGQGIDGVLITASTSSDEPVHQAAQMCRKRGRIVLVGVVGLTLSRADFYEKELSFQVSCSYGPGRYDPAYEEGGHDYPLGYVRWTEQRNFEAVLETMRAGQLHVAPLISHRFPFERASEAYEVLSGAGASLGVMLEYPAASQRDETALRRQTISVGGTRREPAAGEARPPVVGVIGAGNYAMRMLMPALARTAARLKTVASLGGVSGAHAARKFGFEQTTTAADSILADPEINAVVIATRHDSHARLVSEALEAGKHVFVEKPLAIDEAGLERIEQAYAAASGPPVLMAGFNRRFAPHTETMKALLAGLDEPKAVVFSVNAGSVPPDHWVHDPALGGGRIIGEGCHFVDLVRFLIGAPIVSAEAFPLIPATDGLPDTVTMALTFLDGSAGTVHYFANGHRAYPKERLEVFCGERVLLLENFLRLHGYGWRGLGRRNLWRQDKGHTQCIAAFVKAVATGAPSPIPFEELVEVARVMLSLGRRPPGAPPPVDRSADPVT